MGQLSNKQLRDLAIAKARAAEVAERQRAEAATAKPLASKPPGELRLGGKP